jgi:hypothetical protein
MIPAEIHVHTQIEDRVQFQQQLSLSRSPFTNLTRQQKKIRKIHKASPRTTIRIPAGTYTESLTITKEITLQGPDLDPETNSPLVTLSATGGQDALHLASTLAVFRNLRVISGQSQSSPIIGFESGTAIFENCILESPFLPPLQTQADGTIYFTGTVVSSGESALGFVGGNIKLDFNDCQLLAPGSVGILASGRARLRLTKTSVVGCGNTALILTEDAGVEVDECEITGPEGEEAGGGDAIELSTSFKGNVIRGSTIVGHEQGAAIVCNGSGRLALTDTTISNCYAGLVVSNGFTVTASGNAISAVSETDSALVCVTDGCALDLEGGELSGACVVALSVRGRAKVRATGVAFKELVGAVALSEGGALQLSRCSFRDVGESAVMARGPASLEIGDGCTIDAVGSIGLLIQGDVSGFVRDATISGCDVVGAHFVESSKQFVFERCTFERCGQNGVNLRQTAVHFVRCTFRECRAEGEGNAVEMKGEGTSPVFQQCTFQGSDFGVLVTEGATPSFADCEFSKNGVGVNIATAAVTLKNCKFPGNRAAGIWATETARGSADGCEITGSQVVGVLVEGAGTEFQFAGCSMLTTRENAGVGVKDGGVVRLKKCRLSGNKVANVDVTKAGKAFLDGCTVGDSGEGIGVKISESGSFAEIVRSTLGPEKQSAVYLDTGAKCKVADCDISRCATCGVCIRAGCDGEFRGNKIHDMELVGIQVEGGRPKINNNEIFNCETYGVHIVAGAEPQVIDNNIHDNTAGDVNRE